MSEEHEPPNVPGESVAPRPPSPERIADLKARLQADVLLAHENQKLRATISRLREYAGHRLGCASRTFILTGRVEPAQWKACDCGYDELMADLGETK